MRAGRSPSKFQTEKAAYRKEVFAIGQGEKRPHGDEPRGLVAGERHATKDPELSSR